ncbi:MAG: hypothetical protein R6V45_07090 [Oceanipulchritudo sp.]
MKRRKFLKNTGFATALLPLVNPVTASGRANASSRWGTPKPRSRDWVMGHYHAMPDILRKGRKIMWLTGYTQPCLRHGWRFVDHVVLNLTLSLEEILPIPGSLICDDYLTYAWAEKETKLGRIRIDFLMRKITNLVEMKQFLFEENGTPIGRISEYQAKDADCLYRNWYSGLRRGDYAFTIVDSQGFEETAYKEARLEIWTKENAQRQDDGVNC